MEQSVSDRMRFKDKIIDNISKAIKSIQELLYYQSKDPALAVSVVGLTLCNGDRPCHKLCENLDHALLHGLKKVTHGYWQVVKQLSHKEMVKEIDLLTNVTTDLGKGRAWLYASLNESLLESYIRLLCGNDKLLRKYYAKEALILDEDRMNILLTHTSGLEYVKFQLEYDVPYLDLSAYPPRTYTSSEPDDYVRPYSPQSDVGRSDSFRSESEVRASPTEPTCDPSSDSDSASVASLDAHSQSEILSNMKISTISADSGCQTDGVFSDGTKQSSVTPNESAMSIRRQAGTPTDNTSLSSVGSSGDQDRHQRLQSIIPGGEDEENEGDSFKVIRVKNKKGTKSKKKKQLLSQKSDLSKNGKTLVTEPTENPNPSDLHCKEANELDNSNIVSTSDIAACECDGVACNNISKSKENSPGPESCNGHSDNKVVSASIPKLDSGIDICSFSVNSEKSLTSDDHITHISHQLPAGLSDHKNRLSSESPHLPVPSRSIKAQIEDKIAELYSLDTSGSSLQKVVAKSDVTDKQGSCAVPQSAKQSSNDIIDVNHRSKSPSVSLNNKFSGYSDNKPESLQRSLPDSSSTGGHIQHQGSIYAHHNSSQFSTGVTTKKRDNTQDYQESSQKAEDHFDVYSSNKQSASEPSLPAAKMGISRAQATVQLKDYMNYILQTPDSPPLVSKDKLDMQESVADLSLSLDNNTKLQLMLDIFSHEDEKLLKMFVTRNNHTEGDSGVVFVLISDQCLYLLRYRPSNKKFVLQSSAMLLDLLFISTGINEQTLNIESKGKKNQKQRLWLTPGHQALTLAIVKCLTDAVQAANERILQGKSKFSVESEVLLQNIALRKYISRELHCEAQDVIINDYSLVFWEDPAAISSQSLDVDAAYKEGTLLLRNQDPLKTHMWKPVYVVLKNSMLCVSNKKSDPRPHSYLGLGGDQCVGCRSTSTTDREYCVELILAQGGSWFLAAASQAEISEWRHALCLAVSQGTVENNTLSACIPCCAVLSCNQLFLCHEDLLTKFYRTLGRAQLEDVTGIILDDADSTYCIIEFESQEVGVSSNNWVFYFSSAQDLQRYKASISAAWKEIYQIDLPVWPVNSIALRCHCYAYSEQLKQQLLLN